MVSKKVLNRDAEVAIAAGVLAARRLRQGFIMLGAMLVTLMPPEEPEPEAIVDDGLADEEARCAQIRAYRKSLGV